MILRPVDIHHIDDDLPGKSLIREEAASVLVQAMLGKRAIAVRDVQPQKFSMRAASYIGAVGENTSLFLSCSQLRSKSQIRKRLKDIPPILFSISERKRKELPVPTTQERFSVFTRDEAELSWRYFGNIELAASSPYEINRLARLSTGMSFAAMSLIRQSAVLSLLLDAQRKEALREAKGLSMRNDECQFLLACQDAVFNGVLLLRGEICRFTVFEELTAMKTNDPTVNTLLTLGELEFSLDDLLRLRPGTVIRFKKPEIFEGSLRLGGYEWHRVHVDFEGDELRLSVQSRGWQ